MLLRYRLELLLGRTTPEGAACGHLLAGDVAREAFKFEMLYIRKGNRCRKVLTGRLNRAITEKL
jgi:hypothetical protein